MAESWDLGFGNPTRAAGLSIVSNILLWIIRINPLLILVNTCKICFTFFIMQYLGTQSFQPVSQQNPLIYSPYNPPHLCLFSQILSFTIACLIFLVAHWQWVLLLGSCDQCIVFLGDWLPWKNDVISKTALEEELFWRPVTFLGQLLGMAAIFLNKNYVNFFGGIGQYLSRSIQKRLFWDFSDFFGPRQYFGPFFW